MTSYQPSTPQPPAPTTKRRPCALFVTGGLATLLLGAILVLVGVRSYSSPTLAAGMLVVVLGVTATLMGVYRAARLLDTFATR